MAGTQIKINSAFKELFKKISDRKNSNSNNDVISLYEQKSFLEEIQALIAASREDEKLYFNIKLYMDDKKKVLMSPMEFLERFHLEPILEGIKLLAEKEENKISLSQIPSKDASESTRKEFLASFRQSVSERSRKLSEESNVNLQKEGMDEQGRGNEFIPYENREHWKHITSDPKLANTPINIILPGYATGDRYTLGMLLNWDPRVRVHIVYNEGNKEEEKAAKEAYALYSSILEQKHIAPAQRIGLHEMRAIPEKYVENNDPPWDKLSGNNISDACMIWNTMPDVRDYVSQIEGLPFPSAWDQSDEGYLYHISLSTHLISKLYEENPEKCIAELRTLFFEKMIPSDRRKELDELYENKYSGIQDSIILWVGNRSDLPDLRQAEAFSRPSMYEQIREMFEKDKIHCEYAADSWRGRHAYSPMEDISNEKHPLITFWNDIKGRPREEQWYLMYRVMQVNKAIIGNRSGSIEPFALLGMPVIYLEHKDMFTKERTRQLIGRVPTWNITITEESIGYGKEKDMRKEDDRPTEARTEYRFNRDRKSLLSLASEIKKLTIDFLGAKSEADADEISMKITKKTEILKQMQEDLGSTEDTIERGVLTKQELETIKSLVDRYDNELDSSIYCHNPKREKSRAPQ
ncbi:MAG: hypothetical protein HYX61_09955 [Gammaproteobacteria bacterium]|jgi:hypothetical protein|nr:hypothetical protein [Gammaproteobacteria bacterium]